MVVSDNPVPGNHLIDLIAFEPTTDPFKFTFALLHNDIVSTSEIVVLHCDRASKREIHKSKMIKKYFIFVTH